MNPFEKILLDRLGAEVIKKIKSLDTKQLVETLEHFLGEHIEILKKDANDNDIRDFDEALDHFAKGWAILALKEKK